MCCWTLFWWILLGFVGFAKGSGVQWSFSNKASALPHFMSFKVVQDDKAKKVVSDPLMSTGFMPISAADAYDPSQKRSTAEIQVCFSFIQWLCENKWVIDSIIIGYFSLFCMRNIPKESNVIWTLTIRGSFSLTKKVDDYFHDCLKISKLSGL